MGGSGIKEKTMSNITWFDGHWECKVCSNQPDDEGWLEHGRGCYTMSGDGGGMEFVADEIAEKEARRWA
jgi:prepilin-type processing-associated H-X9-DG protein